MNNIRLTRTLDESSFSIDDRSAGRGDVDWHRARGTVLVVENGDQPRVLNGVSGGVSAGEDEDSYVVLETFSPDKIFDEKVKIPQGLGMITGMPPETFEPLIRKDGKALVMQSLSAHLLKMQYSGYGFGINTANVDDDVLKLFVIDHTADPTSAVPKIYMYSLQVLVNFMDTYSPPGELERTGYYKDGKKVFYNNFSTKLAVDINPIIKLCESMPAQDLINGLEDLMQGGMQTPFGRSIAQSVALKRLSPDGQSEFFDKADSLILGVGKLFLEGGEHRYQMNASFNPRYFNLKMLQKTIHTKQHKDEVDWQRSRRKMAFMRNMTVVEGEQLEGGVLKEGALLESRLLDGLETIYGSMLPPGQLNLSTFHLDNEVFALQSLSADMIGNSLAMVSKTAQLVVMAPTCLKDVYVFNLNGSEVELYQVTVGYGLKPINAPLEAIIMNRVDEERTVLDDSYKADIGLAISQVNIVDTVKRCIEHLSIRDLSNSQQTVCERFRVKAEVDGVEQEFEPLFVNVARVCNGAFNIKVFTNKVLRKIDRVQSMRKNKVDLSTFDDGAKCAQLSLELHGFNSVSRVVSDRSGNVALLSSSSPGFPFPSAESIQINDVFEGKIDWLFYHVGDEVSGEFAVSIFDEHGNEISCYSYDLDQPGLINTAAKAVGKFSQQCLDAGYGLYNSVLRGVLGSRAGGKAPEPLPPIQTSSQSSTNADDLSGGGGKAPPPSEGSGAVRPNSRSNDVVEEDSKGSTPP